MRKGEIDNDLDKLCDDHEFVIANAEMIVDRLRVRIGFGIITYLSIC